MEHYLAAGLQDIEGLLSTEEKRGEVQDGCMDGRMDGWKGLSFAKGFPEWSESDRHEAGRRREQLRQECPELLDIPLGVKLPLLPGSKPVFYRTKLGEKLHQPSSYFDLGDPHGRLLSSEYKSLHDPHLRNYYYRKDNLRRLRRGGYITKDDKVVCNLREFNQYRQYLTTLKITAEKMYHGEQKMLQEQLAKLKTVPELPHGTDISRLREWLLWEQRENLKTAEHGMRLRYLTMTAESMEELEAPEDDEHLPQQDGQDEKPLTEDHDEAQTTLTCTELTEDQELDELVESMLEEVLGSLKYPEPSVHVLRRSPLTISGSLFASMRRTEPSKTFPPDLQQEVGRMAREMAATLLDRLGKRGAFNPSDASKPRQRQQPVSTRATRVDKSGDSRANQAEAAGYNRASSLPSLDQMPTNVENVGTTLESFVASEFEKHFQCKFSDRWKAPLDAASKRQPQPPRAHVSTQVTKERKGSSSKSEYWTSEALRLPLLQPLQSASALSRESSRLARRSIQDAISEVQHLHADLKAYAEMVVCDALDTLKKEKKKLEKEMHAKARSFEDTSEESSDESALVDQVLGQCGCPLTAGASGVSCRRQVTKQPRLRDGEESSLGHSSLRLEEKKIPAKKLQKRQHGTKLPPITIPGMVMPSEGEAQFSEELSPPLFPSILRGSERYAESPQ